MPSAPDFRTLRTEIAGVPIVDLAREFGTPSYIYDAGKIVERINDLKQFDTVRFAQKACSNIAILDLMRRHGVVVDAVSAGEIERALAAGFKPQGSPPPIVYTADIFDREALETVVRLGLHVNCGSPDMIDQIGERMPGSNITLRINPGFGHGHSQKTNTGGEQSKHGIWHENIQDALRRADRHGLSVSGLHMHIGSGADIEHLATVCGAAERLAKEVGRSLTTISAGGGLPTPYKPGEKHAELGPYFQLWNDTRNRLAETFGHPVHLELEPGRYLVAESGYLLSEVRAVKEMGSNTFYVVDAGFNNLARPILYGSYHPISIAPASGKLESRPEQDVVVGGPLCESGDIFTQQEGGYVCKRSLPAAQVGDYLLLECAGAYGFVMGSNYNSKPLAAEVLVQNGRPHLIRRRQTPQEVMQGEMIPTG